MKRQVPELPERLPFATPGVLAECLQEVGSLSVCNSAGRTRCDTSACSQTWRRN